MSHNAPINDRVHNSKWHLKSFISLLLAIVLIIGLMPLPGYAASELEGDQNPSNELALQEELTLEPPANEELEIQSVGMLDNSEEASLSIAEETSTYAPLQVSLSYDKNIKVGDPVTFTMSATGASGDYLYKQVSMQISLNGGWVYDVDWSRLPYVESNTFQYTFVTPGRYYLKVSCFDPTAKMTEFYYQYIDVNDTTAPTVTSVVDELENKARMYSTQYEQALYVHDELVKRASYDHSLIYCGASGVLLRGKGTCESYYGAFELVMKRLGIQCYRVEGDGHVWCCVNLDGEWTQIDPTWDDPDSRPDGYEWLNHLYFGLTDDLMQTAHTDSVKTATRPCTGYKNNYFLRSGTINTWSDPIQTQIMQRLGKGETSFTVPAGYNMYPTFFDIVCPLVAYNINQKGLKVGNKTVSVKFVCASNKQYDSYYEISLIDPPTTPQPPAETPKVSIKNVQASCGEFTRNATGKVQGTWVSARYNGKTLTEYTDYQVIYRDTKGNEAFPVSGYYAVCIRGIGNFTGEKEIGHINLMQGPKTGSPVKISSVSNANFVLDASGASPRRGANVTIWSDNGGSNQKWYLWLDDAGYYTLRSTYNNNFTLDAAGATPKKGSNVSIWDANGGNNQKWYIEPTSNGYIFHSVADWNLVLDASGATPKQGANVTTWTNNGGKNQRWNIKEVTVPSFDANRTYQIKSASSSKFVLDASGKTPKIGANVTIWGNNGGLNQRWRLVPVGNGYYYIQSASNNNFLLDAAGKTPKKGSNASIWTNNGGRNQLWKIEPLATGHYVIKNAANESLVLDASGANPKQGANVTTWTSNGGYNQKWIIE